MGAAQFRTVWLGGLVFVRPGVFCLILVRRRMFCLYCDASMAPVLYLRRWLKAAGDALDGVLCCGVTLCGALEFPKQWDRSLEFGACWSPNT